jgi:hypothetical protein
MFTPQMQEQTSVPEFSRAVLQNTTGYIVLHLFRASVAIHLVMARRTGPIEPERNQGKGSFLRSSTPELAAPPQDLFERPVRKEDAAFIASEFTAWHLRHQLHLAGTDQANNTASLSVFKPELSIAHMFCQNLRPVKRGITVAVENSGVLRPKAWIRAK